MKATVIINTYNERPEILNRAVESYRNQTHDSVQIIISTIEGDPSTKLMDKYHECTFSILPKSEHPGKSPAGVYAQLNHALKFINENSQWLCYASGNDYAFPFKIQGEIFTALSKQKEVCYSAFKVLDEVNKKTTEQRFPTYSYERHLKGNFVSDCSLISMRLARKYLPYKSEFGNFAHWDSWLRIFEGEGNVFAYNNTPTWVYVQNPGDMHTLRKSDSVAMENYLKSQVEFIENRLKK